MTREEFDTKANELVAERLECEKALWLLASNEEDRNAVLEHVKSMCAACNRLTELNNSHPEYLPD